MRKCENMGYIKSDSDDSDDSDTRIFGKRSSAPKTTNLNHSSSSESDSSGQGIGRQGAKSQDKVSSDSDDVGSSSDEKSESDW